MSAGTYQAVRKIIARIKKHGAKRPWFGEAKFGGKPMQTTTKPISQAEMARHAAKLDLAYREEFDAKIKERKELGFTINDMSILTGWTKTYFFRLIKDKRIPKPDRHGKNHTLRWPEDRARVVIAFYQQQQGKFS